MANLYIFPPNRSTLNSGNLATKEKQDEIIAELSLDVLDQIDDSVGPVLDASVNNIPASGANSLSVVASLSDDIKSVKISETTGYFIGIYSGPVATPTLEAIIAPGDEGIIPLRLSAGTLVSVRHMSNTAINLGQLTLQFLG